MSGTDLLPELTERLDRLVPPEKTLVADWQDILRRVVPPQAPQRNRRRLRLVLVAAAVFLLFAGIATATYFVLRGGGDRAHGLTIINGDRAPTAAGTAIMAVDPNGQLRVLWRCPHAQSFCGNLTSIAWSADGRRLAFTLNEIGDHSGYVGLHIVDTISGRDLQLPRMGVRDTSLPQSQTFFQRYGPRAIRQLGCPWPIQVAWSADGGRLAYVCGLAGRHAHSRIYVIGANGSGRRAVPTGVRTPGFPSWSPDGTRIAFATGSGPASNPAEHSSVYVVKVDGSGRRLIARHGTAPAWSPDGKTVAYRSTCGLRLVTPDGKDVTPRVMRARCTEMRPPGFPAWSWDGTRLAFGMTSRPWRGLYVLNADGTGLTRVSTQPGIGVFGAGRPAWTPTPRVVHPRQLPPRRSRCC